MDELSSKIEAAVQAVSVDRPVAVSPPPLRMQPQRFDMSPGIHHESHEVDVHQQGQAPLRPPVNVTDANKHIPSPLDTPHAAPGAAHNAANEYQRHAEEHENPTPPMP